MISQQITRSQRIKILPQQIHLLNLFHLTTLELEQRISLELEENPLLEEIESSVDSESQDEVVADYADYEEFAYDDVPDCRKEHQNFFTEGNMPDRQISEEPSFRDRLKEQMGFQCGTEKELRIACFIIDSLNDYGMLEEDTSKLAEEYSFRSSGWTDPGEIDLVLQQLQELDPPGVGARSFQECLLLQLKKEKKADEITVEAGNAISNHFTDLLHREYGRICKAMNVTINRLKEIVKYISTLSFRPVLETPPLQTENRVIIPDFSVAVKDDKINVSLTRQRSDTLQINHDWMNNIMTQCSERDKGTHQYLKGKMQAAEWFISAIRQREQTMTRTMLAIVNWQKAFFQSGDELDLKPMILRNIAEIVQVDISTISRITSNKYAETHFGTILLKNLFSEGLRDNNGMAVTSKVIQAELRELVEAEDKHNPFSDNDLSHLLSQKGFRVARRTVAKYRESLGIVAANFRAAT
ncbi:RNA polymerase factor sigma-54 [Flavihumibacter solisilvae]|uniref:RNA polymerase sigma54 factor n=1 Tax=Flavihumibacter solisilvae TaxID=1349421 RepID=A0A0C1IHV6_9BACT|nr:RNA polymerase factor sigma-54 [Flavihumibacter solisilvae]KIC93795.1 hypothetical protein OI18_15645 [Flavihumibacter solisilvae]